MTAGSAAEVFAGGGDPGFHVSLNPKSSSDLRAGGVAEGFAALESAVADG
jgi:hypothetical protein